MFKQIIGFMFCYNEVDMIEETLQFYKKLGVPLVFIDNGSTDGTSEVANRYLGSEVLDYLRHETSEYDLKELLELCFRVVERQKPDWIMHIDADHLYEPGAGYASFHEHVDDAENRGLNTIDFEEYVFLPTTADDPIEASVYERMKHYAFREPGRSKRHFEETPILQPRLYRYEPGMNISEDGGHTIYYASDSMKIHPVPGVLRHYMFRSPEHGRQKLQIRFARYSRAGRARGWHTQYDKWNQDDPAFYRDPNTLTKRIEGSGWSKRIVLLADGSVRPAAGSH